MTARLDEIVPVDVPSCLRGVRYPAGKRELISEARQNGAPRQVLHVLRQIPETKYPGLREVLQNYKRFIGAPLAPAL
jgi:hypothetical protein